MSLQIGMHWFPERAGGLDRMFYGLSRALPDAGVGFAGLVAGSARAAAETGGLVRAFAPANAPLPRRLLAMRQAFRQSLAAHAPGLIVSHFPLHTLPVLGRLGAAQLVCHFHGPWADEGAVEGDIAPRRIVKRLIEDRVFARAAQVIVLSEAFAELFARRHDFDRERIHVVPGGIDAARFAAAGTVKAARDRLGWPRDRPILVAVRRLVPRMGLETLIDAIAIIKRRVPDVLLVIGGRGALHTALAARIAAGGLERHVRLVGFVPDHDLPAFYRAADLSVVPSSALEGFGLIAAESLAAGTPCLVTPVGGLPEVVRDLSMDLVMDGTGAAPIAAAVTAALLGRLALPNSAVCRNYAARRFDWRHVAAWTAAVYRQVT
jgi:glycosyltransferase involved in cell wall biosynthesis